MRTVLIYLFLACSLRITAQNKINSYQYWFDGQYDNAVSQSITPVATYNLATQINTGSLLAGLHLIHFRFRDDSSRYSSAVSVFFLKPEPLSGAGAVSSYQYWFDSDFAGAVMQPASGAPGFTFSGLINTPGLLNGIHILHMRFKDTAGLWSETLSQFFLKIPAGETGAITAYQYWFDQDFSGAAVQPVAPGAMYTLSASLDATLLTDGLHRLHVRFLDNRNTWSSTVSQFIYKSPAPAAPGITRFQYWFDQDFANASQQDISPSATYNLTGPFNTNALPDGLHAISVRFLDSKGKWSSTSTQFFYKERPDPITENKITAYRYWFDEMDSILNLVEIAPFMNPLILNQPVAADGLDSGQHVIHFQFRDQKGLWSMLTSDTATVSAKAIYTFNGNGNWSNANNWVNKIKPPLNITGTYKIFIDPAPGGQCILDVSQQITAGAIITVRSGKKLVIPGNLELSQ